MEHPTPAIPASRNGAIDLLKCIACIGVIIIHVASLGFSSYGVRHINWVACAAYECLVRCSVPIFLMCTGALLLDPKRVLTPKRIFRRYFLRILLVLLFWAFMYQLYFIVGALILYGTYVPGSLWEGVVSVLTFNHHFHLYYLQILLIIYAFLPMLRAFTAVASRRLLSYALLVWFVLGIIFPFLNTFSFFSSALTGIPAQYPISMTYSSMGYCLLGYWMNTADIPHRHASRYLGIYLLGFLVTFGFTVAVSFKTWVAYDALLESMTPGVALMAAGLFGWITALCRDKAQMPRAARFSKASFCIYLVHHFYVMAFRTIGLNVYLFNSILSVPFVSALVLLCSLITYWLLSKIPKFNRYFI